MFLLFLLFCALPLSAQPTLKWNTPFGGVAAVWSPDGRQIASVGDGGVTFVDVTTGKRQKDILEYVAEVVYSADGTQLVARGGNFIASFNTTTAERIRKVSYQDTAIKKLVISRDKGRACAWYQNNVVVVFDMATLDSIMSVRIDGLQHVAISGDGSRISCTFGGLEGTNVSIYNVGERIPRMSVGLAEQVSALDHTGSTIVTATQNGLLTSWDVKTGNKIEQVYWSFDINGSFGVKDILFAPSNQQIIVIADQFGVYALAGLMYQGRVSHNPTSSVQLSDDGKYLWLFYEGSGGILYSLDSLRIVISHESIVYIKRRTASLSPDAKKLAINYDDKTLRVFDIQSGDSTTILELIDNYHHATRPNVDRILAYDYERFVSLDIQSGELLDHVAHAWHQQLFNVTDTELWFVGADTIEIHAISTGQLISKQVLTSDFHTVPISFPDETHIIGLFTDTTMRKINVRTGEVVWSVRREKSSDPFSYRISPSGKILAIQTANFEIKIYDATNGQVIRTIIAAPNAYMSDFILHPDDKRLIVGTREGDNALRVWDIQTGDSLQMLRGHSSRTLYPLLYPDGVRVLTYSSDSTICLWNIDTGELLVKKPLVFPLFWARGTMVDSKGELLVVMSEELWNANTLEFITKIPNWLPRAFDASGSKLVVERGSSLGVLDILPYVITSTPDNGSKLGVHEHHVSVQPNPVTSTTTVRVQFSSSDYQNIQISDLTGRPILSFTGSGTLEPQEFTIQRTQLPSSGTYYLKATDSTSSITTSLLLAF